MAKRKAQAGRKLVSLPIKTYEAIERLQRELSAAERQAASLSATWSLAGRSVCSMPPPNRHGCLPPNRLSR